MPSYEFTLKFYKSDFLRTLFPFNFNYLIITKATDQIVGFIKEKILQNNEHSFLPQTRVYASKHDFHLRRTVKLDPVAEFFIYDLVARNRNSFRKDFSDKRRNFGFRFDKGEIVSPNSSYRAFKAAISDAVAEFNYGAKFDISSYFNCVYHHDLMSWFNDGSRSQDDVKALDKFIKQTNSGRSVDCLPQGIAPCKIIGSHFIKFVDNSNRLKCDLLLRYMDDFYIFSNSKKVILDDFHLIQRILGERGLSINPMKTRIGKMELIDVKKEIDEIKISLLKIRRRIIETYEGVEEEEDVEVLKLSPTQVDYLLGLLKEPDIEEEDAELVLNLMRDYSEDVASYLKVFLEKFPNLIKNIYFFCKYIADKSIIANQLIEVLRENKHITEYQLFWFAKITEDYLSSINGTGEILNLLYVHENSSQISKAKILEIPENRFGMDNLREEHLRMGKSDWLAWASAIGCRNEKPANRNHLLNYFANASPMNKIIADFVKSI